jgi:hypothetical protein
VKRTHTTIETHTHTSETHTHTNVTELVYSARRKFTAHDNFDSLRTGASAVSGIQCAGLPRSCLWLPRTGIQEPGI